MSKNKREKPCDNCDKVINGGVYHIGELSLCYSCYTALRRNAYKHKNENIEWSEEHEKIYKKLQTPAEKRDYSAVEIRKQITKAKQSLFKKFLENAKRMKGRKNGSTLNELSKLYLGSESKKNLNKMRQWLNKARKQGVPIFYYKELYYVPTRKAEAETIQKRYWKYKTWNANSYRRVVRLLEDTVSSFKELTVGNIRELLKKKGEKIEVEE